MKKFLLFLPLCILAGCAQIKDSINSFGEIIYKETPENKTESKTVIPAKTPRVENVSRNKSKEVQNKEIEVEKVGSIDNPEITNCEKLLAQVRKENRTYMGDELLEVLSKLSLYCAPVDQDKFQDTTVGEYIVPVRACEELEPKYLDPKDFEKIDKKINVILDFCAKISPEPKKGKIFQYLANYDTYIKEKLNNELKSEYPDDGEREIVLKQKLRKYKEEKERLGKLFTSSQTINSTRVNGYVAYGLIDAVGAFYGYSAEAEKQFLASGKQLQCTNTSFPGIQYCGKVVAGRSFSYSLGILGKRTVQNKVDVFKLNNQIVDKAGTDGRYVQVTSPNLRKAFLEQGLSWRDDGCKYFRVRAKDITYGK